MHVALSACEPTVLTAKGTSVMRDIADDFVKLLAIIMVTITLAVSTAAISLMFG
jgi:hypothetical protein